MLRYLRPWAPPSAEGYLPPRPVLTNGKVMILAALRRLFEDSDSIEIPSHKDVT